MEEVSGVRAELDDSTAGIDFLLNQPGRRMARTVDPLNGRDASALPVGELAGLRRQSLEVRPAHRREEIGATGAVWVRPE
jgi:hypothetical protein